MQSFAMRQPMGRSDELGQSRRLSDVGMSASPPTPDVWLRRSEPTQYVLRATPASAVANLLGIDAVLITSTIASLAASDSLTWRSKR